MARGPRSPPTQRQHQAEPLPTQGNACASPQEPRQGCQLETAELHPRGSCSWMSPPRGSTRPPPPRVPRRGGLWGWQIRTEGLRAGKPLRDMWLRQLYKTTGERAAGAPQAWPERSHGGGGNSATHRSGIARTAVSPPWLLDRMGRGNLGAGRCQCRLQHPPNAAPPKPPAIGRSPEAAVSGGGITPSPPPPLGQAASASVLLSRQLAKCLGRGRRDSNTLVLPPPTHTHLVIYCRNRRGREREKMRVL